MEEKELIDLIAGYQANGEDCIDARDIDDLAKAIIAKYPQIESEFVATQEVMEGAKTDILDIMLKKYKNKVINVYCSEVQ